MSNPDITYKASPRSSISEEPPSPHVGIFKELDKIKSRIDEGNAKICKLMKEFEAMKAEVEELNRYFEDSSQAFKLERKVSYRQFPMYLIVL